MTDPPTQYIEIDEVSDDYDPREELKEGDKLNDDVDHDDDFTSMPLRLSSRRHSTFFKSYSK